MRVAPVALRRLWIPGSYAQVEQVGEPEADGWRTVRLLLGTADDACSHVLGFGTTMAVVDPAELREGVIGVARDLVTFYDRSSAPAEAVAADALN